MLVLLFLVILVTNICFNKTEPGKTNIPEMMFDSVIYSVDNQSRFVETQMRNVDFHIDEGIILQIKMLRGRLLPVNKSNHPIFNKKESYILEIYSAIIKMDMKSLSTLLNNCIWF